MNNLLLRRRIHDNTGYLTFIPLQSSSFSITLNDLEYSTDGGITWTLLTAGSSTPTFLPSTKILWRGTSNLTTDSTNGMGTFSATGRFLITGNIMSLYNGISNIPNYAFYGLFRNNTNLLFTSGLELPKRMKYLMFKECFKGCSSLISIPDFTKVVLLNANCFGSMFEDCTSITGNVILPPLYIPPQAYYRMFKSCSGLRSATILSLTIDSAVPLYEMFYNCSLLLYVKALITNFHNGAGNDWLHGVNPTGTFVRNPEAIWTQASEAGIPLGWEIIDAT